MALVKWDPFRDVDRLFDDDVFSFGRIGKDLAVDVYEQGNTVVAEMNLPGVDSEKIDIEVEDNYLRVSGSRQEEHEEEKKNYYSKKIKRGTFERAVRLPVPVQADKAEAKAKNGTLRVVIPKQEETKSNKIKVNVA